MTQDAMSIRGGLRGVAAPSKEIQKVELLPGVRVDRDLARAAVLRIFGWKDEAIVKYLATLSGESRLSSAKKLSEKLGTNLYPKLLAQADDWEGLDAAFGLRGLLERVGIPGTLYELTHDAARTNQADQAATVFLGLLRSAPFSAGSSSRLGESTARTLLERLGAPGVALYGNGQILLEYPDDIRIEFVASSADYAPRVPELKIALDSLEQKQSRIFNCVYRPPTREQEQAIATMADRRWADAESKAKTVFNRPVSATGPEIPRRVRLVDWQIDPTWSPTDPERPRIRLMAQHAWYWQGMGSNFARHEAEAQRVSLDRVEVSDPRGIFRLHESALANLLSVNVVLLTADNPPWMLVQNRSSKNATASWPLQCSAAGFLDLEDGARGSAPNVWEGAVRELGKEEAPLVGVTVYPSEIQFLALCREFAHFEPGLVGLLKLQQTRRQLQLALPRQDEVESHVWVPFHPSGVFEWLFSEKEAAAKSIAREQSPLTRWQRIVEDKGWAQAGWQRFVPLGAMAIIFSLIHLYPDQMVLEEWDRSEERFAQRLVKS